MHFFVRPNIQAVLLQEAQKAMLDLIVTKGMCYEGPVQPESALFY